MVTSDIINSINEWTKWVSKPENCRYDIALFKIWIQFEKFIGNLFVAYSTGQPSEYGFVPDLKLRFESEEQLNAFLREGNRTYVDYLTQIERLSKHIFVNNPFDVIFLDSVANDAYHQIVAIRNYIAHESGEAKGKMIKTCFGGDETKFKVPNDFLLTQIHKTGKTYYTHYVDIMRNVVLLLVNPPQ